MSDQAARFEKHIEVPSTGAIAVDLIASNTPLSKQMVKKVMTKGAVWLSKGKHTQRLRRAKKALKLGETVHVYYDPHVLDIQAPEPTLVLDAGQYSVWNKPYGLLSQGSKWGDHCTVTRWAEQHLLPQRNSFIVHRLDRAANGLIVIAHEKKAAAALSALFQNRSIEKRYQITVHGDFSRCLNGAESAINDSSIDDRHAVSHFALVSYDPLTDRSILDVSIETGRKHQIRRHSAELGYPVVGDRLHGREKDSENLQLCAYFLAFNCPYTKTRRQFNLLASA